jgi:hypothetical protein
MVGNQEKEYYYAPLGLDKRFIEWVYYQYFAPLGLFNS